MFPNFFNDYEYMILYDVLIDFSQFCEKWSINGRLGSQEVNFFL